MADRKWQQPDLEASTHHSRKSEHGPITTPATTARINVSPSPSVIEPQPTRPETPKTMDRQPIHLAFASDENYAPGLQVSAASALLWLPECRHVHVHILDGGLEAGSWQRLKLALRYCHPQLHLHRHDIRHYGLEGIRARSAMSPCAYGRLLLPTLTGADRILYLDVDLLILADLAPIHDIALQGQSVAAVVDSLIPQLSGDAPFEPLSPEECSLPYFNSGVMVMDLQNWRRNRIGERTLEFLQEHGPRSTYFDQTALNHLLRGQWLQLPGRWNRLSRDLTWTPEQGLAPQPLPAVLHYCCVTKPWANLEALPAHRLWHLLARKRAGLDQRLGTNRLLQRQLLIQSLRERLRPAAAAERLALQALLPPRRYHSCAA